MIIFSGKHRIDVSEFLKVDFTDYVTTQRTVIPVKHLFPM